LSGVRLAPPPPLAPALAPALLPGVPDWHAASTSTALPASASSLFRTDTVTLLVVMSGAGGRLTLS